MTWEFLSPDEKKSQKAVPLLGNGEKEVSLTVATISYDKISNKCSTVSIFSFLCLSDVIGSVGGLF